MPLDTLHNARLDPELKALADVPLSRLIMDTPTSGTEDWNTVTTPGYHSKLLRGSNPNGPGDVDYYHVEVRRFGTGQEVTQIGTPYALTSPGYSRNAIVMRTYYAGSWSAWRRLTAREDVPAFQALGATHGTATGVVGMGSNGMIVNRGGCFDTSNHRFTAPVAGLYKFGFSIFVDTSAGSTTWMAIYIRVNGSSAAQTWHTQHNDSRAYEMVSGTSIHQLAAGDYVETYCSNGSSGAFIYGGGYNGFNGHLIG